MDYAHFTAHLAQQPAPIILLEGTRAVPPSTEAMLTLMELGIVRELTGQRRNRVFVYDAYLNILNEGGEAL